MVLADLFQDENETYNSWNAQKEGCKPIQNEIKLNLWTDRNCKEISNIYEELRTNSVEQDWCYHTVQKKKLVIQENECLNECKCRIHLFYNDYDETVITTSMCLCSVIIQKPLKQIRHHHHNGENCEKAVTLANYLWLVCPCISSPIYLQ